jgi:hypothetical protein
MSSLQAISHISAAAPLQRASATPFRTSRKSIVNCQCSISEAATRRSFLAVAVAAAAAVILPASAPAPAQAFGSGFPGYDINMDGRKRALDRNKREMQAELDRAAAYRAKLAAAKPVAAAKPAAPAPSASSNK